MKGDGRFYRRPYGSAAKRVPVVVFINFDNIGSNKLGRPLPAGIIRLYKEDADGSYQFIGEDRIVHTPRKETVKLRVGEAFDVVAERTQTEFRKVSPKQHESAWKITLKNRKKEDHLTKCADCGRFVKKERWVDRMNSTTHPLCSDCASCYEDYYAY